MSEFKIQVQNLYGVMDSTEQLEVILQQVAEGVQSVKRSLRAQIRQRERIDSRLTTMVQQLDTQKQLVQQVVSVGRQVADYYLEAEQGILELRQEPTSTEKSNKASDSVPFDLGDLLNQKNLWKLVGQAGIVGNCAKVVASFTSGDGCGIAKDITKLVGSGAKLADKSGSIGWRDFLGLTVKPKPNGFGDALGQQIGKYKIGNGQSVGKNIAASAKWAGDILTVVETGASNLEEFKDKGGWKNPRMYAETAVESTLKIGSGIAIGTAVAACTPVGWTALAVGAATVATTVVVNWALDGISQLIMGNSDGWVENVSDGILNVGKAIGDGAKKVGKSVAKWWKKLWS